MAKGEYDNQVIAMQQPGQGGYPPPGQTTIIVQQEQKESLVGPIVLSCIVFWLCNCLFGCIAFFIAIGGTNANSNDEAKRLSKASYGVSIAGIIISVIVVVVIVALYFTGLFVFTGSEDNYFG